MKNTVVRTAIVTSLVTALVVTALGMYVVPRLINPQPALAFNDPAMTPPPDNAAAPPPPVQPRPALRTRHYYAPQPVPQDAAYDNGYSAPSTPTDPYGEPVVRHHRSTGTSVAIVAGSAGTGAAIGALAGGGKGAAIGALTGGTAGFIYDRMTANK